jgi:hypothetical protein
MISRGATVPVNGQLVAFSRGETSQTATSPTSTHACEVNEALRSDDAAQEVATNELIGLLKRVIDDVRSEKRGLMEIARKLQNDFYHLQDAITSQYILDDATEIEQEIAHQTLLYRERNRRRRLLEIEQVKKGINTAPETILELEDLQKLIEENGTRIKALKYKLERMRQPTS